MMIQFLWVVLLIKLNGGARILNCPKSDTRLEKIIGLRPPTSSGQQLLFKLSKNESSRPITLECIANCQANNNCRSFVLHYDTLECYWFDYDVTEIGQETRSVIDKDAAWFTKVCLKQDIECKKLWIFERLPGATLIGNDTKTLPKKITRTECQQNCLNEKEFLCRSVKFRIEFDYNLTENSETTGICTLSNTDRHLMPNAYRVSTYDDEYFENQCTGVHRNLSNKEIYSQAYCAYEEYENVILSHSDLQYKGNNKDECQAFCENATSFICRGFSVTGNSANVCLLHSEDTKLHGPKLLKPSELSTYYERARCLDINVSCSETYMTIRYHPETDFHGKLYMQGYSENPQCFVLGQGKYNLITLKLPLLTSECGVSKADSSINRTLLSGTLIIQYNALIQTQSDRILKVGCIFGNESRVLVGTGVKITSTLPNKGSTLLNTSSNETVAPVVEMRIVDLRTQEEVTDTQIGQELQLVIELKEKTNTYDFWASHLIAMTENGDESIFLLDDRGCPTNLNIFPSLTKEVTNSSRKLVGTFQAFKFASSAVVRFSVIIQFCSAACPAIKCSHDIESYGKRKRRDIESHVLETVNGNKHIKSYPPKNESFAQTTSSVVNQMPLEYIMVVRQSNSHSDRLVLGNKDTKILVAGYNYATNEVCMDYSLVLGLIVTWIIIQLIFIICSIALVKRYKRYYEEQYTKTSMEELHKNFGIGFSNLENRRVRWADNGNDIM